MRDTLRIGRQNELKVVVKLLSLGYQVFESVLPNAIDVLVRCAGDRWIKLQVKTVNVRGLNLSIPIQTMGQLVERHTYKRKDVDYFVGVLKDSFYVVPYKRARAGCVKTRYSAHRSDLNRWDLLPPAA